MGDSIHNQAGASGPNPDYNPDEARPMTYRKGPEHYYTNEETLIGFINRLEEECHHNRWLVNTTAAMVPQQVSDVRARNTQLEEENRELRRQVSARDAMLLGANEKVTNLIQGLHTTYSFAEFVQETDRWSNDTFGPSFDWKRTALALVEEAIEVAQIQGVTKDEIFARTVKVMEKPPGTLIQEFGGVAIVLADMIAKSPLDPKAILTAALADCWARQDEIRAKNGIARAVGVGKMVPGALERLKAAGIDVHHTEPKRASIPTGSPFRDRPGPNSSFTKAAAQAIVDERKPYQGDPFAAAEAESQERLKQHVADTAAPHGG